MIKRTFPDRLACISIVVVSLWCIAITTSRIYTDWHASGGDFQIYCGAVACLKNGLNPYLVSDLKPYSSSPHSFVYPLLTTSIFEYLCSPQYKFNYFAVWSIFLVTSLGTLTLIFRLPLALTECNLRKISNIAFFCGIIITGFNAVQWSYLTGNLGIFDLLLWTMIYVFVYQNRFSLVGTVLGVLGWIKLYPLAFCLCSVSLNPKRAFTKVTLSALATLIALTCIGFIYPIALHKTYIKQILGIIPEQHTPASETGTMNNPSAIHFFNELGLNIFSFNQNIPYGYLLFMGLVFALLMTFHRNNKSATFSTTFFSYSIIAMSIILPRFKPYALTVVLIPLFDLARATSAYTKLLVLILASLIPVVLSNFLHADFGGTFLYRYSSLILLSACYILFFYEGCCKNRNGLKSES